MAITPRLVAVSSGANLVPGIDLWRMLVLVDVFCPCTIARLFRFSCVEDAKRITINA